MVPQLLKFLCLVIDRDTRQTLAEYEVEATETYFARMRVVGMFEKDRPECRHGSWYVDSLCLTEGADE